MNAENQSKRLAIIDTNRGYVWGHVYAENAIEACRAIDGSNGDHGRTYSETPDPRDTSTGYRVYEVQDDLEISDGQDGDTIESVESGRYVGYVAVGDLTDA